MSSPMILFILNTCMKYNNKTVTKIINGWYTVNWSIGNFCNFNCPYCFDHSNLGNIKPPTCSNTLLSNTSYLIEQFKKIMNNKNKLQFIFDGGEPTLWKDFPNLCRHIKNQGALIRVITNGSMPITWWEKNYDAFDRITISYHTYESNLEHITKVVDLISSKDHLSIGINIMIGKQNFEQALKVYKNFDYAVGEKYKNFKIKLSTIRPTSRNNEYQSLSKKDLKLIADIQKHRNNLVKTRHIDFKYSHLSPKIKIEDRTKLNFSHSIHQYKLTGNWIGYECWGPIQWLQIDHDGCISKLACGQKILSNPLSIQDYNFKEKFEMPTPVTCAIDYGNTCNCVGLFETTKRLTNT